MERSFWISAASLVVAGAAAAIVLALPSYTRGFENAPSVTLIEINGPRVILPVVLPVIFALVPVLFPARVFRITAAVLMGGFALIGAFTIGIFYFPAAFLMVIAACTKTMRGSEA